MTYDSLPGLLQTNQHLGNTQHTHTHTRTAHTNYTHSHSPITPSPSSRPKLPAACNCSIPNRRTPHEPTPLFDCKNVANCAPRNHGDRLSKELGLKPRQVTVSALRSVSQSPHSIRDWNSLFPDIVLKAGWHSRSSRSSRCQVRQPRPASRSSKRLTVFHIPPPYHFPKHRLGLVWYIEDVRCPQHAA
uniref:ARAD1D16786p n=1 Tax=Blastobotrys adeninivorans TaxID=409370 RepID=A0A060T9C0_BLAAD